MAGLLPPRKISMALMFLFLGQRASAEGRSYIYTFSAPTNGILTEEVLKYPNKNSEELAEHFYQKNWVAKSVKNVDKSSMLKFLREIQELNLDEDDQLILYFSGHGMEYNTKQYLLLTDSIKENLSEFHSVDGLAKFLDNLKVVRKALVISACQSGNKRRPNMKGVNTDGSVYNFAIISASTPQKSAYEVETSDLKGCIFTHFLIEALNDETVDSLVDAYDFSIQRFERWVRAYNTENPQKKINQSPMISMKRVGVSKILTRKDKANFGTRFGISKNVGRIERVGNISLTSMGPSKKIDINGIVKIVGFRADGTRINKSIKIDQNKDYNLNMLIELCEPDHSAVFSIGQYQFKNENVSAYGLTHKYQIRSFKSYAKYFWGSNSASIEAFGKKFSNEQKFYGTNLGLEYPMLLDSHGTIDFFLNLRSFASIIYWKENHQKPYFRGDGSFELFGGLGTGFGLSMQYGTFELSLDANVSQSYSDISSITELDVSLGGGFLW